jgi:hypothetical protein
MAISPQLRKRIEEVADDLNFELYGPRRCPPWGTKFVDMEQVTTEVGDAVSCVMLSAELQRQAEAEGHPAGKCGGCGEPIPFDEVAGRLLDARRGEIAWQESFGRCKRCRKAFFPSLPSLGNRAG